jgi:hypothetical protein
MLMMVRIRDSKLATVLVVLRINNPNPPGKSYPPWVPKGIF